ncbi:MAG: 4'-phosphopantetheinyl transferase superfamily protein, partial [Thermodesulfobacteriota bacterium]
ITHSRDRACAVVARKEMTCGVGVDLEALEPRVNFNISTKVCTEAEQAWLAEAPDEKDKRLKMIFSAKEAGFNAEYADLEQVVFDFDGVFLDFDDGSDQRFDFIYKI